MSRRSLVLMACTLALAVGLAPRTAGAMTFRQPDRSGTIVVGPGETIHDDLYASGSDVVIRGTVDGSVYAAGNSVSIEGSVTGDVWAAGNEVRVAGDVGRTLHAAGNTVAIGGRVGDDLLAAGSSVVLDPATVAGRDAALAANRVVLAGTVKRNAFLGAAEAVVAGSVGGDVTASVDRLSLSDGAKVGGDLRYQSGNTARIAPGASVAGRTVRSAPPAAQQPSPAARVGLAILAWIRRLIGLLLFGLLVAWLVPLILRDAADRIAAEALPSLGIGFVVLLVVPPLAFLVFLLGLLAGGWWISLLLLAVYFIAVAVATIVSAVFLGRWLLSAVGRHGSHDLLALLLGLTLLTLAEAVPILGALVRIVEVVFGLGALTLVFWRRRMHPAATPAATPAPQVQPTAPAQQPRMT